MVQRPYDGARTLAEGPADTHRLRHVSHAAAAKVSHSEVVGTHWQTSCQWHPEHSTSVDKSGRRPRTKLG